MAFVKPYHKQRPGRTLVAAVLLVACLLSLGVCPMASAAEGSHEDTTEALLTQGTTTIRPSELLASLVGEVSEAEALWLDHQSPDTLRADLTVTYDHTVPSHAMQITHTADGSLVLTATPYDTTHGTTTLTWTPTEVTVDDTHYALTAEGDAYIATLPAPPAEGSRVTLHLTASLTVAAEDYNALINAAYEAAEAAQTAWDAYEEAKAAYEAKEAAYAAYEEALAVYRAELAVYQAYQKELNNYHSRLDAYEAYLADMETYQTNMALYENYLEAKADYDTAMTLYMEFVNYPTAYEARYLAYMAYLADRQTVEDQLAVIDSCFAADKFGHVLYNTLKGPTVAAVVSRKEELVSAGCSEADIDNADSATAALTALLEAYPQEGTQAERYAYYIANYTELRYWVKLLYTSLATLYTNDLVPDMLHIQGRLTRYHQFVGQLYVLGCLLDDKEVWQSTWSMGGAKLTSVVDACYLLTDRNKATPLAAYPEDMAEVPSPDTITKPVPPAEVICPTEPPKVEAPVPPTEVSRPSVPMPVAKPDPTASPVAPMGSAELESLRALVQEGTLTRRAEDTQAAAVVLHTRNEQMVYPKGIIYAQLYGYDLITLYDAPRADGEGYVTLPTPPTVSDDSDSQYTFVGWAYADGTWLTESTPVLTEPTAFYPVFSAALKTHTVTWVVGDDIVTQEVPHGVEPIFTGSTAKAQDATSVYEFTHWSPAPSAVTSDVTYTAQYRAIPRTYTVTWQCDGTTWDEAYTFGTLPVPEAPVKSMSGRYAYVFTGWSPVVVPVEGDAVYQATFEAVDLLPNIPTDAAVTVEQTEQAWIIRDASPTDAQASRLFDISRVAALATADGQPLILVGEGVTIRLNDSALQLLMAADAAFLAWDKQDTHVAIGWYDANRQPLTADTEPISVQVTLTPAAGQSVRLYHADGRLLAMGKGGESVTFTATDSEAYTLYEGYTVTVIEADGGIAELSVPCAPEGASVTFTVTAQPGYDLGDVQAHTPDGTPVAVMTAADGTYHMVMPSADVTVTPMFTPRAYHIVFKADGRVISEQTCRYGEMPTLPADPTKADDDTYRYVFNGWAPTMTAVLADATYEATFLAIPLHEDVSVKDTALRLWQAVFIGASAYLVTTAAILVPYLAMRKRRR